MVTAGLFVYMSCYQVPGISKFIGGMKIPDELPFGYGLDGARALFEAFKADHAAAQVAGRTSASEAYVSLHAGSDLVFPPLLAASLAFCGFAALFRPSLPGQTSRMAAIGFGLVLALAFTHLACDFIENAVADAMFGPKALALEFNAGFVFVLRVLTNRQVCHACSGSHADHRTLGMAGDKWPPGRFTLARHLNNCHPLLLT